MFEKILFSNPQLKKECSFYEIVINELLPSVWHEIFNIDKPYTQLNFPCEGGVTGYFSRNMNKKDLALI